MTMRLLIGNLDDVRIEMAERKGIGHPDTICDEIAEHISIALSRYYLEHFGAVMHHNVDKALLVGGQSQPAYGGGKVLKPISLIIAGRATERVGDKTVPVAEIAVETARNWLARRIRHLDVLKDVHITANIRPGSAELVELFNRFGRGETPLANDTSFGAGYYPLTPLEQTIIRMEELLNDPVTKKQLPFIGEDIKVMGVKDGDQSQYTLAIAIVDRYISNIADYISKIKQTEAYLRTHLPLSGATLFINTADDYARESIYLTVTGASAESGDDGQVGRGNRINGLITPYQPMSLEAAAGKNPVSHVGKIYNYFAMNLSRAIVEQGFAGAAQVFVVSQIGKPVDQPALMHIRLQDRQAEERQIEALAKEQLSGVKAFWRSILNSPAATPQNKTEYPATRQTD